MGTKEAEMNIAIIRCKAESKLCSGERCFAAIKHKEGKFSNYNDINIVSFTDCGGCNNLPAFQNTIENLLQFTKVDIIHLANCIVSDSDEKFRNLSFEEIFNCLKEKGKKRFNDEAYIYSRSKLLYEKDLPFSCAFKDDFLDVIRSKNIIFVLGTHWRISLLDIML